MIKSIGCVRTRCRRDFVCAREKNVRLCIEMEVNPWAEGIMGVQTIPTKSISTKCPPRKRTPYCRWAFYRFSSSPSIWRECKLHCARRLSRHHGTGIFDAQGRIRTGRGSKKYRSGIRRLCGWIRKIAFVRKMILWHSPWWQPKRSTVNIQTHDAQHMRFAKCA